MNLLIYSSWRYGLGVAAAAAVVGGFAFFLGALDELQTYLKEYRTYAGGSLILCYILYMLHCMAQHDLERLTDNKIKSIDEGTE